MSPNFKKKFFQGPKKYPKMNEKVRADETCQTTQ